jgi:hypothetical protein
MSKIIDRAENVDRGAFVSENFWHQFWRKTFSAESIVTPDPRHGRRLLDHAGKISAETARAKVEQEYDHYRTLADAQPRPVDADFEQAAKQLQKLPRPKKPKAPKS